MEPPRPLPVPWHSLTGGDQNTIVTVRRGHPLRVGIHLGNGRGGPYVIRVVRLDVLPAGIPAYQSIGRGHNPAAGNFDGGTNPHVWRLVLRNLPSRSSRDVAIVFDGTDQQGRALPPGRYQVGMLIATQMTGEDNPGEAISGPLMTVDYRG
jgi:hypothetical protein